MSEHDICVELFWAVYNNLQLVLKESFWIAVNQIQLHLITASYTVLPIQRRVF